MHKHVLRYAGVGPRKTPAAVLSDMTQIAQVLGKNGWWLSSGWGKGADQAFAAGAPLDRQTQYLGWARQDKADDHPRFKATHFSEKLRQIAGMHHPYWNNMRPTVQKLMMRNVAILLGDDFKKQVDMVIYWQSIDDDQSNQSGTNHTRRVASTWGIPTFNIRLTDDQEALVKFVERMESENA